MFAAQVDGPDGTPVLRLWEWERTRDLPYHLDFWLPDDSDFLLVGVRIRNPHPHDVPVYWWSNIAVAQTPDTRVLAPATQAWHYGYSGRLDLVDVPGALTYPARAESAADYFFECSKPWIAAVDGDGRGLLQTSTERLRGRKLFLWGESAGGRMLAGLAGAGRRMATWRSRPGWPARSWSTCGSPRASRGTGSRRTARSRPIPRWSTATTGGPPPTPSSRRF